MKKLLLKIKNIPTTKLLISFLFIDCVAIQLFVCYVTCQTLALGELVGIMPTFQPLITLVGSVVTEVIGFSVYCLKSSKENSKGGIVYDMAIKRAEEDDDLAGNG